MPQPKAEIAVEFVSKGARVFRLVAASEDARWWVESHLAIIARRIHPTKLYYHVSALYDFNEVLDFAVNGYTKDGAQ